MGDAEAVQCCSGVVGDIDVVVVSGPINTNVNLLRGNVPLFLLKFERATSKVPL